MFDQKKPQDQSLEINHYKSSFDNSSSPYSKNKSNQIQDNTKENCDSNRQYLISDNSQSAINPLTKSGEDLTTSNNLKPNNLFSAVECNDLEKVSEILSLDNSKINDLNEEGLSLLHIAVIKANTKMINLLFKFGADSNILSDKKKQTPLHLAYLNQNSMTEEIIKELIKNNAKENILDSKNKKPSDYMCSSYKKNKNKKFNIDNNNEYGMNNSDKKSYTNNNTGNTVTIVTIENHLDSFLTTNKEEENKSNINNINTNSNNNTIVQSPTKLDVDYDLNEIISINNSVEKSNSQLNQRINNSEDNLKKKEKENKRRQYTFGKEEDFMKFQKNNEKNNEENKNNITKNSTFDNLDINNNYYFESIKNEENKKEEKNSLNNSIKEEDDYEKTVRENEILNDSLEEKNEENQQEEDEKEEKDNYDQLYDSLKNNNILSNKDKDNINSQNSFNLNNNSLTYTDSLNVNGSCFQSKNKTSNIMKKSSSNNNTNENEENENEKKIVMKTPSCDNKINIDIKKTNKEEKIVINDDFLEKIITKKRNSFSHSGKNKSIAYKNNNLNKTSRNSVFNKTAFNLENDTFNNSMRSNRTSYLSPSYINNKITGEKFNTLNNNNLHKQKKRDSYNSMIYQNNSYKNNITIVHNGTDSRFGISGNLTQYSTQSQKKKKNLFSSDKIKVIMSNNYPNQTNKITEFNYLDNINNINNNIDNNNIYKNESNIDISDNNININLTYLKYWLSNLGLLDYLNNFIKCNAYDINELVERMKSYQTKLRFEDLESSLKIRTPGYVYRILCKLEADAGLIDPKIVKFMIREGINNDTLKNNNMIRSINNKSDKNMNISISQSYYQCLNCCKLNQIKKQRKNDLKYFLIRYNLVHLFQNFNHNGFDMIEYVIIQMYSSFPINEDILENCFHIYDENQRRITLKAIVAEMKKINKFLNSEEYNNSDKNQIKYDNIIFEDDLNRDKSKIAMKNNDNNVLNNCDIF